MPVIGGPFSMKQIFALLIIGPLISSCGLKRNDFISTENIGKIGNEKFFYSAFQTGIDNYTIEFKEITDSDTSKIFDYYINDAVFTKEHSFYFKISGDTLYVLTPFQSCKTFYKTKKGTTVEVTKNFDSKVCKD